MAEDVFVGRRDERARFAALLRDLVASGTPRGRRRLRGPSGENPAKSKSRVVLVHGLGGSGKSRLLSHFRAMTEGEAQDSPVAAGQVRTAWLDWEKEVGDNPARYAGATGPSLVTVLDAVQMMINRAFSVDARAAARASQAFADYRQGAARMPEYAPRFAAVITESTQAESVFTREDAAALLKAAASASLAIGGHPGGVIGLAPSQLAGAAQATGHLSEAAVRAVTGKKPNEISPAEYDLVTDPPRELGRRAGAAISTLADAGPLIIFLDTGEVIGDRAWKWLRRVMTCTGPRVAWVVGARFETEAEAGFDSPVAQFVRDIGDEHLTLMSPTRFDDDMIRAYLEGRLVERSFTDAQIDMIAHFTRGLPLAISLTATLLDGGQPVQDACSDLEDGHPSSVISGLARRYLVHAERQEDQGAYSPDDPRREDVTKILGLALAFRDVRDDPDLLAALWETDDPLTAFRDLARRHDFVLPAARRLHDDVRDTLRTDLLDPWHRRRIRPMADRAVALSIARLTDMRRRWPTLDEQLNQAEFTTTLLGLLWYASWASNQDGLDHLITILPVLAATDRGAADAAAELSQQFASTYTEYQRDILNLLTEETPASLDDWLSGVSRSKRRSRARRVNVTHAGLDLISHSTAADGPQIGQPGDLETAALILRARLHNRDHQDPAAVTALQAAASQVGSARLRRVIGTDALAIAQRLIWAGPKGDVVPTDVGLAAAGTATEMLPERREAWRNHGIALRLANRPEEALAAHDQAIALDPDYSGAHNSRGMTLYDLGRPEEALAAYDQAIALNPRWGNAHNNRGNVLRDLGRPEEALAAYDQAIALDPRNVNAHSSRGRALRDWGRYEEALASYDRAIALDPRDSNACTGRGIMLRLLGRYEEALAACDHAITLDAGNSYAHIGRGYALSSLGRHEEALAAFDQAIALDPSYSEAHSRRGHPLRVLGRHEEALAAYDQAIALDPRDGSAYSGRGYTLNVLGRTEEALTAHKQAITLSPRDSWVHTGCGVTLRILGRLEEALAAHDQAIALNCSNDEAHNNRGNVLRDLGRLEEALAAHDQAIALDPGNRYAHNNRGRTLRDLGRCEEALAAHDQAIALDPGDSTVHNNRGNVLRDLGRLEEALAAYDQAIALDPGDSTVHNNRGNVLRDLGRLEEALAAYDQAIALDPGNRYAHNNRGRTLRDLGRCEEALAAHDQAIALDPGDSWVHNSRGFTLRDLGRLEEALAAYDQAIALDPGDSTVHNNRGNVLRDLGRLEEALAAYDQAIALDPGNRYAHNNRGRTLRDLGRCEEALAAHDQAIALDPGDSWVHNSRGFTLRDLGRLEEALAAYNQAIELDPSYKWAISGRGETYRRMGRHEEALADLDRAIELDPSIDWNHYLSALLHLSLGQTSQAQSRLRVAVEQARKSIAQRRSPSNDSYNLAVYLGAEGKFEEARLKLVKALKTQPSQLWESEAIDDLEDLASVRGVDSAKVDELAQILKLHSRGAHSLYVRA